MDSVGSCAEMDAGAALGPPIMGGIGMKGPTKAGAPGGAPGCAKLS